MKKEDYQLYLDRWKLVEKVEAKELKDAPFELMLKQTISIWDMSRTLQFTSYHQQDNNLWSQLQKELLVNNASKPSG